MADSLQHFKPRVNKKTLLLLSASIWTVVGLVLVIKGVFRLIFLPEYKLVIVLAACLSATIKSKVMLDQAAIKGIQRILNFEDGICVGAVYSIKTWFLVLCMIGMGVILRNSSLPITLLSFIYLTIGLALMASSRHGWRAWASCK
jgi:hypothetical protein